MKIRISEWKFSFFTSDIVKRELENYSSNKKFYINFKQSDNTKKEEYLGEEDRQWQCAGKVIPSGIIMVGRRVGVWVILMALGVGEGEVSTFNGCFILPTIFFYHCNLEAKKKIHPHSLFQILTEIDENRNSLKSKASLSNSKIKSKTRNLGHISLTHKNSHY